MPPDDRIPCLVRRGNGNKNPFNFQIFFCVCTQNWILLGIVFIRVKIIFDTRLPINMLVHSHLHREDGQSEGVTQVRSRERVMPQPCSPTNYPSFRVGHTKKGVNAVLEMVMNSIFPSTKAM